VKVALISTYDLGRQPFGLASPAAWLRRDGHQVECLDLAVEKFREAAVRDAELAAFFLPMHTATRLALPVIDRVRSINPGAKLAAYGLYAPLSRDLLRAQGVATIIGGEFEAELAKLARGESAREESFDRLPFLTPDRSGLAGNYAKLRVNGAAVPVAYTEATRGCKHLCRHCPVVPVYQGKFRVVPAEVVLADIRQQVARGARHVTFGDPDFLNGPTHAMRIVDALHREFPDVTYDATIKVEHLLNHRDLLPRLRDTGCLFVISAVESLDDAVLAKLDKGHTRQDFLEAAALMRETGLTLQPTFIAFTPWTTLESYRDLLRTLVQLDLAENVAPVQLALRLLVTEGSRLREYSELRDGSAWKHSDPRMDALASRVFRIAAAAQGKPRTEVFAEIAQAAGMHEDLNLVARAVVPYLDEPWYC
jgi:radical SAM superfamily enzyme YgiQ (UPF0313 family)